MAIPIDQTDGTIWLDGKLIPAVDAKIHLLSHGLHYASTVFEGERAYGGEIFKSIDHSLRLKTSAEIMDFEIPYSVAEIDAAKRLVVETNNLPNSYIRTIAWRGSEMMAGERSTGHMNSAGQRWLVGWMPQRSLPIADGR